jgi:cholest-4-en-3-one 26-monooxygenase
MIAFDDPEYGGASALAGQMAAAELFMYANELAEDREKNPRGDVVSLLMQAEVDGERLSRADFSAFFMLLLVAGNETTRNLISGGLLALIEHPEQRARLMADRSLLPSAIEEMLRWVSPVNVFRRTATRDVEVGGRSSVKATSSPSSTPRPIATSQFQDPDTFDIARHAERTPGVRDRAALLPGGELGAARIRVMFEELLRRLPDLELAGRRAAAVVLHQRHQAYAGAVRGFVVAGARGVVRARGAGRRSPLRPSPRAQWTTTASTVSGSGGAPTDPLPSRVSAARSSFARARPWLSRCRAAVRA